MASIIPSFDALSKSILELDPTQKSSSSKNRAVQLAAGALIASIKALEESKAPIDLGQLVKLDRDTQILNREYARLKTNGVFRRIFSPSKTSSCIQEALTISSGFCKKALLNMEMGVEKRKTDEILVYFEVPPRASDEQIAESLRKRDCPASLLSKMHSALQCMQNPKDLGIYGCFSPLREVDIKENTPTLFFMGLIRNCETKEELNYVLKEAGNFCIHHLDKLPAKELADSLREPVSGWDTFSLCYIKSLPSDVDSGVAKDQKASINRFLKNLKAVVPEHLSSSLCYLDTIMINQRPNKWSDRDLANGICYGRSVLAIAGSIDHSSADEKKARFIQAQYEIETLQRNKSANLAEITQRGKFILDVKYQLEKLIVASIEDIDKILPKPESKSIFSESSEKVITGSRSLSKMKEVCREKFLASELSKVTEALKKYEPGFKACLELRVPEYGHAISIHHIPASFTQKEKYLLLDPNNRDDLTGNPRAIEFPDIKSLEHGIQILLQSVYKAHNYQTMTLVKFEKTAKTEKEINDYIDNIELIDKPLAFELRKLLRTETPDALSAIAQKAIKGKILSMDPSLLKELSAAIVDVYGIDGAAALEFPEHNLPVIAGALNKVKAKKLMQFDFFAKDDNKYNPIRALATDLVAINPILLDPLLQFCKENKDRIASSTTDDIVIELQALIEDSLKSYLLKNKEIFVKFQEFSGVTADEFLSLPCAYVSQLKLMLA